MSERREERRDAVRMRAVRQVKGAADDLLIACAVASDAMSLSLHMSFDVGLAPPADSHLTALLGAINVVDKARH